MWYNTSQKLSAGRIGTRQHYRLRGCGIFLQPFLCCVYGMGTSIINSRWGAFLRPMLFLLRPRTSATPRRASTNSRSRSRTARSCTTVLLVAASRTARCRITHHVVPPYHSQPRLRTTHARTTHARTVKPLFRRTILLATPLARSYLCNRVNSTIMSPCPMRVSM